MSTKRLTYFYCDAADRQERRDEKMIARLLAGESMKIKCRLCNVVTTTMDGLMPKHMNLSERKICPGSRRLGREP